MPTKDTRTPLEIAQTQVLAYEGLHADGQKALTAAEKAAEEAEPEQVITTRQIVRTARTKVEDLGATLDRWRARLAELQEQDRKAKAVARLAELTKEADPKPVLEAHQVAAQKLFPLVREIATTLERLRLDSAKQHLNAGEAEALAAELGQELSVARISPDQVLAHLTVAGFLGDVPSVRITVPKTKKDLLTKVLAATGHDGCYLHDVLGDAAAAGIEDDDAVIASALDGTLGEVLRRGGNIRYQKAADAQAAQKTAEEAKVAAQKAAEAAYEIAMATYPHDWPKRATPEQNKALEDAELALFGERKSKMLQERRQQASVEA